MIHSQHCLEQLDIELLLKDYILGSLECRSSDDEAVGKVNSGYLAVAMSEEPMVLSLPTRPESVNILAS